MLKSGQTIVTAKREAAEEEPKLSTIRPPVNVLNGFGFFFGRLYFGGDYFLTTFSAYVLRQRKTLILNFLGFGLSRGHGLHNTRVLVSQSVIWIVWHLSKHDQSTPGQAPGRPKTKQKTEGVHILSRTVENTANLHEWKLRWACYRGPTSTWRLGVWCAIINRICSN